MPQDLSGSDSGNPGTGRTLVEPAGYAVTSFLATTGLVIGIGLAWTGLLLAGASILLSVIEWRRIQAANPWLKLEDPDDFRTHEGRVLLRYSAWGTGVILGLSLAALLLVAYRGDEAAAIGPGLIAGIAALVLNFLLKRAMAKPPASTDETPRMGGEPPLADPDDPRFRDDDADRWSSPTPKTPEPKRRLWDKPDAGSKPERQPEPRRQPKAKPERRPKPEAKAKAEATPPDPRGPAPVRPDHHDPDDGFQDQDFSALNGKPLEERPKAKTQGKRRRDERDDD